MDQKSKKLQCPFTWDIDKTLSSEFIESEESIFESDEEPLLGFTISIAFAYFEAQKDVQKAIEKLEKLDDAWKKLDKSQLNNFGVSVRVLCHVKEATKFYIYELTDHKSEAECILKNLEDGENFGSPSELATINGCKSVVWSNFHRKAHEITAGFARLAVSGSPHCPLWFFVLGKSLRHVRGDDYCNPVHEEEECVLRSCELSDTPFYKMRLAQIYREKRQLWKASKIYLEIYESNPKGQDILLRLARAFTHFGDYEKATACFDKAEKYPKNTMYHNYKGLFFRKIKNYEMAAFHFKEATSVVKNYRIRLLHGQCLREFDEKFDFIDHLKSMLDNGSKHQLTLLHIAMNYFYKKNDVRNGTAYLLKAIAIDPRNKILEDFGNTTINWEKLNIYHFTQEKFQEFQSHAELMEEMKETVEKLDYYCQEYRKHEAEKSIVE